MWVLQKMIVTKHKPEIPDIGSISNRLGNHWNISKIPDTVNQLTALSFRHLNELSKLVDKNNLIKIAEMNLPFTQANDLSAKRLTG